MAERRIRGIGERLRAFVNGGVALVALAACAGPNTLADGDVYDPIEPVNRAILTFNEGVDTVLLRPAAETYRFILPQPVRDHIQSILRHMQTPINVANEALQGDWEGVKHTSGRFIINSVAGVGGLVDVAGAHGMPYRSEDFGQTLAVWGVGDGPYLVLPFFGPSNLRDAVGQAVDSVADPISIVAEIEDIDLLPPSRTAATALDGRSRFIEEFDQLRADSFDLYASLRSIYQQRRAAQIADGEVVPAFPNIDDLELSEETDRTPSSAPRQ